MRKYFPFVIGLLAIPLLTIPSITNASRPVAEYWNNPVELSVSPGQVTTDYITVHFTKDWVLTLVWRTISSRGVHTVAGPNSSNSSWTWFSTWYSTQTLANYSSCSTVIIPVIGDNSGGADDLLIYEYVDVNGLGDIPTLGRAGMLILILVLGILAVFFLRRKTVHRRTAA
ncbi:MAG: hypothetical protein GTO51_07400 [Candidatus Latescibacteria bacterium]|nr:hypothetical protein [Candidatus Latescibacterota bacterium]NIM65798.1 hypothetical protein [Candidatus Latescibacterota bacterium]NIO02290.1 hypothetical protein [Candidatus Latescibacterota bacterium]NIO29161.1 hypothetical protein [Candidatus Latescibacterota bacterium]NIO56776.1 hypothetical protein [Candidatus Latescibacterota bacterium]